MIDPVDSSLVNRAAKYGIMFVAMAFMAVFCLNSSRGARAPVQYLFTSIAMVFFYCCCFRWPSPGFTLPPGGFGPPVRCCHLRGRGLRVGRGR
jgi:hypothetical protein